MTDKYGLILLTGPPGVGKTTLVRKICDEIVANYEIVCHGFYTEEVRDPATRERVGFDVVTLDRKRTCLSRSGVNIKGPYVGKYGVYVKDFENLALPLLKPGNQQLLVIDEIGKMELKSKRFEAAVNNCLNRTTIMATIPYEMRQPLALVETLKQHPHATVIVVNKENRNRLQAEIVGEILKVINK